MRVLVTGGAGFIGSNTVDLLVSLGHDVSVVDNLVTGSRSNLHPQAAFHEVDVTDDAALQTVFERERPEAVIHLAAQMDVRISTRRPVYDAQVNILGSLQVIEGAVRVGTRKVIYASSGGAIYGEPLYLPVREDHPVNPLSQYGVTKHTVEHYLYLYAQQRGLAYTALRYANVYGPRQNPAGEAGVIAIFIRNLLLGLQSRIFGDGKQTRDYVYVGDVAAANVAALHAADGMALHIGSGIETTVNELYEQLARILGVRHAARHEAERPGEVLRIALDSSLAAEHLGWRPEVSLSDGLNETVDYLQTLHAEGNLA
ncbi:MAG: NAD-dependent epimerase/dehydratase family protein [Thermaerobacter sp.]|nr:NAD-dependent epimerase/dehydratase family protein [Thermaerobacter sp.]